MNAFWKDFSDQNGTNDFLSANFPEASANSTEILLALASLDLPFSPGKIVPEEKDGVMKILAPERLLLFCKKISEAEIASEKAPVFAAQRYFRNDDRYIYDRNRQIEKYVSGDFLQNTVYGCAVTVTNSASEALDIEILMQIPEGAIPVQNGFWTKTEQSNLAPFTTRRLIYYFYFPKAGKFGHYPAQVSIDEKIVAFCEAATLNVVEKLDVQDTESWDYISQEGSDAQVLSYLSSKNLNRISLSKIAFRMRNKDFFMKAYAILNSARVYDPVIWSYGIFHNHVPAIREYLQNSPIASNCGSWLKSDILDIDPVMRRSYQFLEYSPFVNDRTMRFGPKRSIQNDALCTQYQSLLGILSYKKDFDNDDLMSIVYYLLLQDRVEEGLKFFSMVKPERLPCRLQYDYFSAYLAMSKGEIAEAEKIAGKYKDYPVPKWKNKFAEALLQIEEIKGGKVSAPIDKDSRDSVMGALASKEAAIDFDIDSGKMKLHYENVGECTISYYLMDIEFLFSKSPFSSDYGKQFSYIFPNKVETKILPKDASTAIFEMPPEYNSRNLLVEISASGKKAMKAYFSNTMTVQMEENYGQLKVSSKIDGKRLSSVYVKVYSKMKDGTVSFYKDGYTDMRGQFDYASLNTDQIKDTSMFSILILSRDHGAAVREVTPPAR